MFEIYWNPQLKGHSLHFVVENIPSCYQRIKTSTYERVLCLDRWTNTFLIGCSLFSIKHWKAKRYLN